MPGKSKSNNKKSKDTRSKDRMPKDYSLYKDWRHDPNYKSNVKVRDRRARKYISENYDTIPKSNIEPGMLIMFDYFEPKFKADLEYYDAMPSTIFFNVFKTKEGETRVLGFNLHYYPPRVRVRVMNHILEIFKEVYKKSWNDPEQKVQYFDYKMLIYLLKKSNLEFGVHMYIPNLMANITPIAPKDWVQVCMTEGRFKKATREAIMKYWKSWHK